MSAKSINLPYFDPLLEKLECGDSELELVFGRHVHWGYWPYLPKRMVSSEGFARAAEKLTEEIYRAARVSNNQCILDVGCGFDGTIASLNENFSGMQLVGLSIDSRQLLRAQEKVKAYPGNFLCFEQGNACVLPFSDQSFDVVLAVECIFHFSDRKLFFKEEYRVLKPGSYLALSDFVPRAFFLPLTRLSLKWPFSKGFFGRCNLQCTLARYRLLAETAGFKRDLEKDITENTLPTYSFPTYSFLRLLCKKYGIRDLSARFETWVVEQFSHLGLLRYRVLSFRKQDSPE